MTPTLQVSGYHIIGLTKNGEQKIFRFHRIVAAHFCKKKKGCNIVNHKNGVKTDNRSENLEWTTVSGNTSHSFAMGLQKPRMGERSNWAVLSEAEVVEIREKHKTGTYTQKQLGIMFNVSRTAITMIVNRKRWSHI